jgi:hypothetical protein
MTLLFSLYFIHGERERERERERESKLIYTKTYCIDGDMFSGND